MVKYMNKACIIYVNKCILGSREKTFSRITRGFTVERHRAFNVEINDTWAHCLSYIFITLNCYFEIRYIYGGKSTEPTLPRTNFQSF